MKEFFAEHGKVWPLMCMEFWDGWFNRWKEPIIKRDPKELAEAVHEVLQEGSIISICFMEAQLWLYEWMLRPWDYGFTSGYFL